MNDVERAKIFERVVLEAPTAIKTAATLDTLARGIKIDKFASLQEQIRVINILEDARDRILKEANPHISELWIERMNGGGSVCEEDTD